MACMEHECLRCGKMWMDNNPRSKCSCGGHVSHRWDEEDWQRAREEATDQQQERR